jgi:chemotaxis protein CheZ
MGHSDAITQQQLERATEPSVPPAPAVQVWGDTSHFAFADALPGPDGGVDGAGAEPHAAEAGSNAELFRRIGNLTRMLHDALRELGYHETLADARDNLPDARDRLAYIARLTGEAAEKVLNAVDRARTVQDSVAARALALRSRWSAVGVYAGADPQRATPAGAELIEETRAFFDAVGEQAGQTNDILTEIMMAQDFHDLTGQVIRKVVSLSQNLEEQLVKLLIDATPPEQRRKIEPVGLEGPVVDAQHRTDVVSDQAGVDDLLASLGF